MGTSRESKVLSSSVVSSVAMGAINILGVWAAVLSTLERIAGIQFIETEEYPVDVDVTTVPFALVPLDRA